MRRNTCQRCGNEDTTCYRYAFFDKGYKQFYRFYHRCSCGKKFSRDYDCTMPDRQYFR